MLLIRDQYIQEINALSLGKLVSLCKTTKNFIKKLIIKMNYIFRKLHVDSPHLHTISQLSPKLSLNRIISEVLALQLTELKQLDQTGNFGNKGLGELLTRSN